MGTARELAEQALRIAADLRSDQVASFKWQTGLFPNHWLVTIDLTDGSSRKYDILEEKERDTPSGESHLW